MKKAIALSALCLSVTVILIQSNSFSAANVKNETNLSIVSEDEALVAIKYPSGGKFSITNNKEKRIVIDSIEVIGETSKPVNIEKEDIDPGKTKTFELPENLTAKEIKIQTYWKGGSAEIYSVIPQLKEK